LNINDLKIVAIIQTIGAFLLVAFLLLHLYLITTGHTITSNLKARITGYEDLEDDDKSNLQGSDKLKENISSINEIKIDESIPNDISEKLN